MHALYSSVNFVTERSEHLVHRTVEPYGLEQIQCGEQRGQEGTYKALARVGGLFVSVERSQSGACLGLGDVGGGGEGDGDGVVPACQSTIQLRDGMIGKGRRVTRWQEPSVASGAILPIP